MKWPFTKLRGQSGRSARRATMRRLSQCTRMRCVESLESRRVLDANVIITEIVASNDEGLEDEDGDRTDWIELFNAGDTAADLTGWRLTDDAEERDKWSFPAVTLAPDQYLIVYASGKDRATSAETLHTNFRLGAAGEYLALTRPDDSTVVEFSPGYPSLLSDRSFGLAQDRLQTSLITESSEVHAFVPNADNGGAALGTTWTSVEFDDSNWLAGPGPVGLEGAAGGYTEIIGLDIEQEMWKVNSSAYIRIPFSVDDTASLFSMTLRMRYDDGYVAYLNGVEISKRNAPDPINWDSDATGRITDAESLIFEDADISQHLGLLRTGTNVLAIHGLNSSAQSNDFLIGTELLVSAPLPVVDNEFRFFARPTPGGANGLEAYRGLVQPVSMSQQRGFYNEPIDVELVSSTPGATLVYTTDGSPPSMENGAQVVAPDDVTAVSLVLRLDKTTTLRAAAFRDDFLPSQVSTQTYLMLADVVGQTTQSTLEAGFPETWGRRNTEPDYGMDPDVVGPNDQFEGRFAEQIIDSLKSVPSISIVTQLDELFDAENGIYANSTRTGFDWERAVSVEVIDASGELNYQADAGFRIAGDNVRNFDNSLKQSFRLEFRERYGPRKLRLPLFGEDATDSFDTIILRGAYNDGWVHTPGSTQYIRDSWARETLLEMGRPQANGRFVHVYLNGVYWGLYNAVERPNASFSSDYFGGDKDDWDALNTGAVRDGDANAWQAMRRLARDVREDDVQASNAAMLQMIGKNPDGTDNPDFEVLIDLGNYIDYLIVNHYGGNVDWPGRNYYAGRLRGSESTGFKYYAWDTEKILNHGEGSTLATNRIDQRDGVADVYGSLRTNAEFRLMFADRIHAHFFNGGALYVDPENPQWDASRPELNQPAARYAKLADDIELPLVAESARWGDTQSGSVRNDNRTFTLDDWRNVRDNLYERYFPRRSDIVLEQYVSAGLYPELAAPVFNQHGGEVAVDFQLVIDAPGEVYVTLDGSDPRQSALEPGVDEAGISPNALRYVEPLSLEAGTVVKARTFVDGQWSALTEAAFTTSVPPIRISEVMYHPNGFGSTYDSEEFEFVELVNVSKTQSVNLGGVAFTQGIQFSFPEIALDAGERIVVVRNMDAFRQIHGSMPRVAGEYGGTADDFRLSNGGETLRLVDSVGQVIQEVSYDDAWHASTDGDGASLTIIDPTAALETWNASTGWRPSAGFYGSPGLDDGVADTNDDGVIDGRDVDLFCRGHQRGDLAFDLTGDGSLDDDLEFLIEGLIRTSFGDSDLNGRFDSSDLVAVLRAGHYDDGAPNNSAWSEGDWNCDGDVDSSDFVLAFRKGGYVDEVVAAKAWRPRMVLRFNDVAAALAANDVVDAVERAGSNSASERNWGLPELAKRRPISAMED